MDQGTKDQSQQVKLSELTLDISDYGYIIGDIIQGKTRTPTLGDVIVFNLSKNKRDCLFMGWDTDLGKVIGIPGQTFSFQNNNLKIRTEIFEFDRDYFREPAIFEGKKYKNLDGKNITLQSGEYLVDERVGSKCPTEESGANLYNRFTVNEEAIIGIIVKKIGHDKQAEEKFRNIIY